MKQQLQHGGADVTVVTPAVGITAAAVAKPASTTPVPQLPGTAAVTRTIAAAPFTAINIRSNSIRSSCSSNKIESVT